MFLRVKLGAISLLLSMMLTGVMFLPWLMLAK